MPSAIIGYTLSGTGLATKAATSALTYSGKSDIDVTLTGVDSYTVDLAMMPAAGLKGLLVIVDPLDAAGSPITAPVTITWTSNAVSKSELISAGSETPGFFAIGNPTPVTGITALSLTSTANAVAHVVALG